MAKRISEIVFFPPMSNLVKYRIGKEDVVELHEVLGEPLHFQIILGSGITHDFHGLPAGITKEEELNGKTE